MSEKIKMGIISDTHGLLREEVKERLKDCTYIFHAGDVDRPEILDELRTMGFLYVVRGNNDGYWAQNLRRSLNFSVGNVKFSWSMTEGCGMGAWGYSGGNFWAQP